MSDDMPDGDALFGEQARRDFSNRASAHLTSDELRAAIAASERMHAVAEHRPHQIVMSPARYDYLCKAMGVESFTLQELIAWASEDVTL